jgi:hypothetical protein
MVAEVFASLSVFKTAFDLAKGLKDIDDAARRNAAVIELQEKILAAREAQSTLLERISELEKEVANFKTWNAEKVRYELKQMASVGATFSYAVKAEAQGAEPFHCICAACYQNSKKSILQFKHYVMPGSTEHILACPVCQAEVHSETWPPLKRK